MFLRKLIINNIHNINNTYSINQTFDKTFDKTFNNYAQNNNIIMAFDFVSFLLIFTIIFISLLFKIIVEPNNTVVFFMAVFLFVLIMLCFEFIFSLN